MSAAAPEREPKLVRRLGLFDATMLVMGGIIGSGIFVNPAEVARHVSTPALIVGVWLIGGAIAIMGAFVYAELAARRPEVGGQYAYLRDAWGPMPAFLYGWSLLLVIQSGGMAAVAITFARYFHDLTHLPVADGAVAAAALALLTAINCLGVRAGSNVQSVADGAQDRRHPRHRRLRPARWPAPPRKRRRGPRPSSACSPRSARR